MKIFLILFSTLAFSQTTLERAQIAFDKKYDKKQALIAKKLYEQIYSLSSQKKDKCFCLNRLSYLDFLAGTRKTIELPAAASKEEIKQAQLQELALLKTSISQSKKCTDLFGSSLNVSDYSELSNEEIKLLSQAYYLHSTSLARASEIEGFRVVLKNWPKIKKTMKFIINLKQESTFYFGPFRTLGIANTKMPSPFGNKKEALKYLTQASQQSRWESKDISKYIYNSIALADYYKKTDDTFQACSILKKIINVSKEEIIKTNHKLIAETLIDQKRAAKNFENFSCN